MSKESGDAEEANAQDAPDAPPSTHVVRRKDGRFEKGSSGNPKGRPRKMVRPWSQRRLDLDVLKEANRPVPIQVGGRTEWVTMHELMFRAIMTKAAKGDLKAFETAMETIAASQRAHQLRNPGTFHWLEKSELEVDFPALGTKEQAQELLNSWRKDTKK